MVRYCVLSLTILLVAPLAAARTAHAAEAAPVTLRIAAEEARQGVASDGVHVYAIDNDRIGKYRISDGVRVARWQGERAQFPHMNSCTVVRSELICAASNYPALPQTSAIEIFDTKSLRHLRSISLGMGLGSLTALDWHGGHWWAIFANYDGKGGEPGRDHRYTTLVQLDDRFRQLRGWLFPASLLARFAPFSCSGMSWSDEGTLYVTGHDRPELYALRLPQAGSTLDHLGTIAIATEGQAIDWDPKVPGRLWSIMRGQAVLAASAITWRKDDRP
ncbi:hypothetical protein [Sphingobium algorifonticola]|uniref:Uncharacterized protein n=1 Tax=Sphingobium algorifonticola TaxID=2008318 RepID=A0A437JCK7_9SPHN|nr:hypothetical protein [Sphingobium algorifonticola]RVT43666.1 hypothetical protein ENE74_03400 [Sphingobium algorifonticola]